MKTRTLIAGVLSLSMIFLTSSVFAEDKPAKKNATTFAVIGEQSFGMIIHMKAKPDRADALIELFRDCVAKTRQEPGCHLYHLVRDDKDSNQFYLIETWEDKASHEAHMQQKHTKDLLAKMNEFVVDGSIRVDHYKPVAEPK